MDQQRIDHWLKQDAWNEKELQELCCGLEPNGSRPNTKELNEAKEAIRRAVSTNVLSYTPIADADSAESFYGHARLFTPSEAIAWAKPRFSKFPAFPVTDNVNCTSRDQPWPWGEHETLLLNKLGGAANRFWKLFDPDDPSTAPTNEQVTEWLKKQGVSQRIATAMATILRADNLPTGPRK